MSDVVIRVENLYKEYRLGTISHGTLYRDLQSWWARLRGKEDPNSIIGIAHGAQSMAQSPESGDVNALRPAQSALPENPHFLALRDVSFEVRQGEVLGIIGRNGAGKSTLLKILSEVTSPTKGSVKIKGRVASLLEVGTGFHPELTGRENVYLNGAILGMKKKEINRKFDEIVAFAEVERFIDTPVKRYSSGMYVRLAFAVAAHLDPEILIIDEVLAVGDAQFQKKCLGKMGEVSKAGRTVLFVSHNMAAVENLCNRGIVLEQGMIIANSGIGSAIVSYLGLFPKDRQKNLNFKERQGQGNLRISNVEIRSGQNEANVPIAAGSDLNIEISYKAVSMVRNPRVIIGIYDPMNVGIARFDTAITEDLHRSLSKSGTITCSAATINIVPGHYYINISFLSDGVVEDYIINVVSFDIIDSNFFRTGKGFDYGDNKLVKVLLKHTWSFSDHTS